MSEMTPETLRVQALAHTTTCARYQLGRANTTPSDCTCWVEAHASAWEADLARIEALGKYARHKASCPVSLAWGKGPGGTGIECDCGFAALAAEEKKP